MNKTNKIHNDNSSANYNNDNIAQSNADNDLKIPHNSQYPKKTNKRISPLILSERLKQLRKENHLTQKALAKQIGVTTQAVSHWESGKGFVPIRNKHLEKLSSSLICTKDYLTGATDIKNAQLEGDEIIRISGMSKDYISEIRKRLPFYSYAQREFLHEFLYLFETLSPTQLELLKRFVVAIASSSIPSITSWHPLFDSNSFHKIFIRTKHQIDEIKNDLLDYCESLKKDVPETIKRALNNLDDSFEKDYQSLSKPLLSEKQFMNSLKNLTTTMNYFIESLRDFYYTENELKFQQELFSSNLNKALNNDIHSLFHLLKNE